MFSLFERPDCRVGVEGEDFFDILVKGSHINKDDLVVDPVGLALVHGLHDLVELLLLSLVVVLQEIHQIAFLEVA